MHVLTIHGWMGISFSNSNIIIIIATDFTGWLGLGWVGGGGGGGGGGHNNVPYKYKLVVQHLLHSRHAPNFRSMNQKSRGGEGG